MRKLTVGIGLTLLLLLTACGSSSPNPEGNSAGGTKTPQCSVSVSESIGVERRGTPVSQRISPESGGSISAKLADGSTATLTLPVAALETNLLVTLVPLATDDGVGVAIEPSGTWLDANATLSFDRPSGKVWARIGSAPDADRFVPVSADRSAIPIARFRPFIVSDKSPVKPVAIDWDWERDIAPCVQRPSANPSPDDPDEFDIAAYYFENPTQGSTPRSNEQNTSVRVGAGGGIAGLNDQCDDKTKAAASRVADAANAAGTKAQTKPKCVRRVLDFSARMQGTISGDGASLSFDEVIQGHGIFIATADGPKLTFPLEGYSEGFEKAASMMNTGIVWGFGTAMGINVPTPSMDTCTMSPLQSGQISGTATLSADSQITFSLTPSGEFLMDCGEWGVFPTPPMVWEAMKDLGLSIPLQVTVPDGQNQVRVLSELLQFETAGVQKGTNGNVLVNDSGFAMEISLLVGVFWSRADRCDLTPEEKAKGPDYEREVCGTGPS